MKTWANKIWSFYPEAKKLYKGGMVVPRMVSVWLSQVCNLRCEHCLYKEYNEKVHGFIDTKKMLEFVDEIAEAGVESVEFSGGGEPLLHPDAYKIAAYIKKKGMKVGVLTNGTKVDVKELVESFSYVRMSLDASSWEEYNRIKNPSDKRMFYKVKENIIELVDERKTRKRPVIGIKFLVSSNNYKEIGKAVEMAWDLRVDYIQFKPVHTVGLVLSKEQREEAKSLIEDWREISKINIIGGVSLIKSNVRCFMSPIHSVVDSRGNIYICCYFENRDLCIGNVFDEGFGKVWGGKKHRDLVKNLSIDECNKYDCRWHRYNMEMKEEIECGKDDLSFI